MFRLVLLLLTLPAWCSPMAPLRKECLVKAPAAEVWRAWTTTEGVQGFLAPQAWLEAKTGGAFEMSFVPEAPAGMRGSEGCTVLVLEEHRRLAFTWNFPPTLPALRALGPCTRVTVELETVGDTTRVILLHEGWKEGEDWAKGRSYFDAAWDQVLARLQRRFESGPLHWNDPDGALARQIGRLSWMVGRWKGRADGQPYEEHWSLEKGAMVGMFRKMHGANSVFFEIMVIEPGASGPVLRLRHFGPGLLKAWEEKDAFVAFRLTQCGEKEAVFEGEGGQAGKRLTYRKEGPDGLLCIGEFIHGGKRTVERFVFQREER